MCRVRIGIGLKLGVRNWVVIMVRVGEGIWIRNRIIVGIMVSVRVGIKTGLD